MPLTPAQESVKYLWIQNFFLKERAFPDIKKRLAADGANYPDSTLFQALRAADYLTKRGSKRNYVFVQRQYPSECFSKEILPNTLIKTLGNDFETEIHDLNLNYGRSGTCTAFLLRKILEKLIFLAFAKNSMIDQLKDRGGSFIGLKAMLEKASQLKANGSPFLMPKTVGAIEGIKFLGDTSAHNPLTNVDMKTIQPQMPYIITAYQELSKKL